MEFVDTANDPRPGNLVATNGLVLMQVGGPGPVYVAPLDDGPPSRYNKPRKRFDEWWNAVIILDEGGQKFTRKDLVLALANKEGGAHVDPELDAAYGALSRSGSLGWMITGGRRESGSSGPRPTPPVD